MFSKTLDDADVLYYTPKGDFGMIYYTTGEVFDAIAYLAACKYPNTQNEYYLFDVGYTNIVEFGGINSWPGELE